MKIETTGGPDDLIKRLDCCPYCIFENILNEDERRNKVLDVPLQPQHLHRIIIEQLCRQNQDGQCNMKYAAQRSSRLNDDLGTQIGALNYLLWDIGRKTRKPVTMEDAAVKWTKYSKDIDPTLQESFAKRFRDILNLGIREDGRQILTIDYIYETVRLNNGDYEEAKKHLGKLWYDHKKRHEEGNNLTKTGT